MSTQFICQDGASLYYLETKNGQGGFLNPPQHAEHIYSIIEKRGGHETDSMSLSYAAGCEYLPARVRARARALLAQHPGKMSEEWVHSVYNYFRNCYSRDGINRNVSDCIVSKANTYPADYHLAYLFIREFFPDYPPRHDLIQHNGKLGSWSNGK